MSVEARLAIADLLAGYSFGYDMMEWDRFEAIWAEDAVVMVGGRELAAATFVAMMRTRRAQHAADGVQPRHAQSTTLFDELTPEQAATRTILLVAHQHEGEPGPRLAHSGYYRDTFRRTATGWRITRREIVVDHD